MDFDFIIDAPVSESERADVVKMFVEYIDAILVNTPAKSEDTPVAFTDTQEIEKKVDDLTITISKQFFKSKPSEQHDLIFEEINYHIRLVLSHFSPDGTTIHSEDYKYASNRPTMDFVERLSNRTALDGAKTNSTTEKYEVGKDELTKMFNFTSNMLGKA